MLSILGENVSIGPFSIVRSGTEIGQNTVIGSHCDIGIVNGLAKTDNLIIAADSTIRSHSIVYLGSRFGPGLTTGHNVTLRENLVVGRNFQVGTLSDLQGDSEIGDFVRFHSNVHIGKASRLGNFVWVFPYVVFTNDPHPPSEVLTGPTVEEFAVIATGSILLPNVTVSKNAFIGASTVVSMNVPEGMLCVGNPCKIIGPATRIKHKDTGVNSY